MGKQSIKVMDISWENFNELVSLLASDENFFHDEKKLYFLMEMKKIKCKTVTLDKGSRFEPSMEFDCSLEEARHMVKDSYVKKYQKLRTKVLEILDR